MGKRPGELYISISPANDRPTFLDRYDQVSQRVIHGHFGDIESYARNEYDEEDDEDFFLPRSSSPASRARTRSPRVPLTTSRRSLRSGAFRFHTLTSHPGKRNFKDGAQTERMRRQSDVDSWEEGSQSSFADRSQAYFSGEDSTNALRNRQMSSRIEDKLLSVGLTKEATKMGKLRSSMTKFPGAATHRQTGVQHQCYDRVLGQYMVDSGLVHPAVSQRSGFSSTFQPNPVKAPPRRGQGPSTKIATRRRMPHISKQSPLSKFYRYPPVCTSKHE